MEREGYYASGVDQPPSPLDKESINVDIPAGKQRILSIVTNDSRRGLSGLLRDLVVFGQGVATAYEIRDQTPTFGGRSRMRNLRPTRTKPFHFL